MLEENETIPVVVPVEAEPLDPPEQHGRWYGLGSWLANLYQRITLSFVLSALLHLLVAGIIALILLHGGGGEDYFHDRKISVSLVGGAVHDGGLEKTDAGPESDTDSEAKPNQATQQQQNLADSAVKQQQQENAKSAEKAVEGVDKSATRVIRARTGVGMQQAEKAHQQQQQKLQAELAALQAAGKAQSAEAQKRMAAVKAELARLARERANRKGREVHVGPNSKGGGGESIFRPVPVNAHKIVYVVDRSGSMHGQKFQIVQSHLVESINALDASRSFWVVFYANSPTGMGQPQLLPATDASKAQATQFIQGLTAGGGTIPDRALEMALDLKPDLIYLLTDGQFNRNVVGLVDRLNANHEVIIDTICFCSPSGAAVLREIAKKNGGTFTMVMP